LRLHKLEAEMLFVDDLRYSFWRDEWNMRCFKCNHDATNINLNALKPAVSGKLAEW
jgi:hypothetical protein